MWREERVEGRWLPCYRQNMLDMGRLGIDWGYKERIILLINESCAMYVITNRENK